MFKCRNCVFLVIFTDFKQKIHFSEVAVFLDFSTENETFSYAPTIYHNFFTIICIKGLTNEFCRDIIGLTGVESNAIVG